MKHEEDRKLKYPEFKQLMDSFYKDELQQIELSNIKRNEFQGKVKIKPTIIYEKKSKEIRLEFSIGIDQMYKLKNITEFYDKFIKNEDFQYSKNFKFIHRIESFTEDSRELLKFLLRYAEVIRYANSGTYNRYRYYGKNLNDGYILINSYRVDELFDILNGKVVEIENGYIKYEAEFVDKEPKVEFSLIKISEKEYMLYPNLDINKCYIIDGNSFSYLLCNNKLYRCSKQYSAYVLKILRILKENYQTNMKLDENGLKDFFSLIVPSIKDNLLFEENAGLDQYIPKELITKVYIDSDKNKNIIANVIFCYEDTEFNPFTDNPNIQRDVIKEANILNHFRQTGFKFDKNRGLLVLTDEEKIYDFLVKDIEEYKKSYKVFIAHDFKERQIKFTKISEIGIKVENNLLKIDLKQININKSELKDVLKQYHLKKKYYRLKDGTFIDLYNNSDIVFLDDLVTNTEVSFKDLEEDNIILPIHRSFYLNQLLDRLENTKVKKEEEFNNIISRKMDDVILIPNSLTNILRDYQKTGVIWLNTLEKYKFGGILADDMGLGKTIQVLTILQKYLEENKEDKKTSIVVSPSSLSLNWYNEVKKFTPNIKVLIIRGNAEERKQLINNIENYDLVITSYDLLKRDFEIYKEKNYIFQYIIADEAQYIKNSNTKNSKTIKAINGVVKFALTGTPIENSLAELWSIFDFIMPGYLYGYRKFKERFEIPIIKEKDEDTMKKLKQMIGPFVLRRTKKEVLKELPDKTITILNNEMEGEQLNIYLSYMAQAKQEIREELQLNGIKNSHIKILSLLTRLRQICCYPGLFLYNYKGDSSKLNQCTEIIKEATKSGHKILLFSSYTSMFQKIGEILKKEDIPYFKLTGQTKVEERTMLVEEFNKNENVKVFLISLKAGGTGLNLTGADMVIHYDPWWNMSAENQAADRTHRIGQKKHVQVYKLVTKNSIEERIYELQQKKSDLVNEVLSTQSKFINKLTKEDIMNLFEI